MFKEDTSDPRWREFFRVISCFGLRERRENERWPSSYRRNEDKLREIEIEANCSTTDHAKRIQGERRALRLTLAHRSHRGSIVSVPDAPERDGSGFAPTFRLRHGIGQDGRSRPRVEEGLTATGVTLQQPGAAPSRPSVRAQPKEQPQFREFLTTYDTRIHRFHASFLVDLPVPGGLLRQFHWMLASELRSAGVHGGSVTCTSGRIGEQGGSDRVDACRTRFQARLRQVESSEATRAGDCASNRRRRLGVGANLDRAGGDRQGRGRAAEHHANRGRVLSRCGLAWGAGIGRRRQSQEALDDVLTEFDRIKLAATVGSWSTSTILASNSGSQNEK